LNPEHDIPANFPSIKKKIFRRTTRHTTPVVAAVRP